MRSLPTRKALFGRVKGHGDSRYIYEYPQQPRHRWPGLYLKLPNTSQTFLGALIEFCPIAKLCSTPWLLLLGETPRNTEAKEHITDSSKITQHGVEPHVKSLGPSLGSSRLRYRNLGKMRSLVLLRRKLRTTTRSFHFLRDKPSCCASFAKHRRTTRRIRNPRRAVILIEKGKPSWGRFHEQ